MEFDNDYLERQERQQKFLRDQYNETAKYDAMEDYQRIIQQSNLDYAIRKEENLENYITRLEIHVKFNATKNIKTHIQAPKGCWYTHKSPLGCFMCDDMNMISYMLNLLKTMAKYQPEYIPRH